MTLPSDLQIGKCLEWYTELPFSKRPRESPVFLIQNTECYFQFEKPNNYYFLYLKTKPTCNQLKSFPIIIYSDHHGNSETSLFSRYCATFQQTSSWIHHFHESSFTREGQNLKTGLFIRFCFIFKSVDGPLSLKEKSGKLSYFGLC